MLGRLRNSFAEVNLAALEQNYLNLQSALKPAGTCALAPMVKADAYGHGDIQVARVCERLGARYLGVALIEEGIKLRLAGVQTPILVFGPFDSIGADAIVKYRLTPVLGGRDQIDKLKIALTDVDAYPVHLKFNTGMQRIGFEPDDATQVFREISAENFMRVEGVCTHFASSEDFGTGGGATEEQIEIFKKIMKNAKDNVPTPILFHYMNSAAILVGLEPRLDLARPGLALYGAIPKIQKTPLAEVQPVMSVKSFIGYVHSVKKGKRVSYGGTWQAPRDSLIGVVPLGYADGVPRVLSNKGKILVHGRPCAITGIVCMDYFMVDLTDVARMNPNHILGEEVVLLGRQGDSVIRVEEMAEWALTVPYEILTGMQSRLPRIYIH